MAVTEDNRSVPTLVSDLIGQVSTLFRKEIQLARAEVSEKFEQALGGVGAVVAGAILLIAALGPLLNAATAGIASFGIAVHWAALIVGIVVGLIGFIVLRSGMSKLSATKFAPQRTVEQVQRDATLVKEQVR